MKVRERCVGKLANRSKPAALKLANLVLAALTGLVAINLASCGDSKSPISPTPNNPSNSGNTPTISSIAPAAGSTAGGTSVTITGTNFVAGATVTFGGNAATDVAIVNATTITAKSPQRAAGAGAVEVAVTASGRTGMLANGFTYVNVSSSTGNAAPVISRIRARGTRPGIPYQFADLGEEINIVADVQDADTPLDQLAFEWKATGGTISGSGPTVRWRAPDGSKAPVTVTLTVIDRYNTVGPNGTPVTLENRVEGTTLISVHDSVSEIRDMAVQFLIDFSKQELSNDEILRNFTVSAGCPKGRGNEMSDVIENKRRYKINTYFIDPSPPVTVAFAGVCKYRGRTGDACAYVPSRWESYDKDDKKNTTADGTDQVSAMYENNRWYLCDSDFIPKGTNGLVISPFMK